MTSQIEPPSASGDAPPTDLQIESETMSNTDLDARATDIVDAALGMF